MSLRYQRKSRFDVRSGVSTFEGLDPLTGLPVLIYEFAGQVSSNLDTLESENIPGVLAIQIEEDTTQVVVAHSKGYAPLGQPLSVSVQTLLLDSARALRDAAAADVLHGDINAERFWGSSEHVLVEGFGIPWQQEAPSLAGDIKDWASAVRIILPQIPDALEPLLTRCEAALERRPSAEELYQELSTVDFSQLVLAAASKKTLHDIDIGFAIHDLSEDSAAVSSASDSTPNRMPDKASSTAPVTSTQDLEIDFVVTDTPAMPQAVATPPKATVVKGLPGEERSPGLQQPGLQPPDRDRFGQPKGSLRSTRIEAEQTKANKQTFIKNLPPGATYRAGSTEAPPQAPKPKPTQTPFEETFSVPKTVRNAPPWGILATVFLAAIALVFGAFVWQGRSGVTFTGSSDVNYLVEMTIGPPNIPPVELLVVQSPEGSRHAVGSLLVSRYGGGTHQLVLDREGTWQLQARIRGVYPEDVSSSIVSLTLPQQRNISFTLPVPSNEPAPEDEAQ